MSVIDDRFVLDQWNGRPTEILIRNPEGQFLLWLVIGQNESVDVWLQLELRPGEFEELSYSYPPDLWRFVGDHKESAVRVSLEVDGVERAHSSIQNPGGEEAVETLLASFMSFLVSLKQESVEPERARIFRGAIDEIESFLAYPK